MSRTTITVTTEIDMDVATAAKWFSGLDDDQMCQFFVAVAAEAATWPPQNRDNLWYHLGKHLRECGCSTQEARDMIHAWAYYTELPDEDAASLKTMEPLLTAPSMQARAIGEGTMR